MKILVNYADASYRKAQQWNTWTGKHIGGFDKICEFSSDDIDVEYRKQHEDIFSIKRGNGLWLWKPYFIKRVLEECQDGDIVFYCDSGAFFVKSIDRLISSMKLSEKIWVSDNPTLESCFTKPMCFKALGCEAKEYKNSNQIQATYLMLVACEETKSFVREWLHYCELYELLSPEGDLNLTENRGDGFVAHREDQSILSILCKRNGIKPHRDPSQRGRFPETFYNPLYAYCVPEHVYDNYGTVVVLHKAKKPTLWILTKLMLQTLLSKYKKNRG